MQLTKQLTPAVILIALFLSGCVSTLPRRDFNELPKERDAVPQESNDKGIDARIPRIWGSVERQSIQLGGQFPIFVW